MKEIRLMSYSEKLAFKNNQLPKFKRIVRL